MIQPNKHYVSAYFAMQISNAYSKGMAGFAGDIQALHVLFEAMGFMDTGRQYKAHACTY